LGLARDQFVGSRGWPPELYIREARRMVSPRVITEADCLSGVDVAHPVGLASYKVDCHPCRRLVVNGTVASEGALSVGVPRPYPIPYEAMVPSQDECDNLIVSVCVSCSHVAWASLRMEPVFMIMGHAAAVAASLRVDQQVPVQKIPYASMRALLLATGQGLFRG
jgi:hypothetical protein